MRDTLRTGASKANLPNTSRILKGARAVTNDLRRVLPAIEDVKRVLPTKDDLEKAVHRSHDLLKAFPLQKLVPKTWDSGKTDRSVKHQDISFQPRTYRRFVPVDGNAAKTVRRKAVPKKVIRIAVMGVTGAGKSTFIRQVTGDSSIRIGQGMESETQSPRSFEKQISGATYVLVDTPGFDDTKRSNAEILKMISDHLNEEHRSGNALSGIIYLHPINRTRVQGSTMTQLRVFQELCGSQAFDHVVLGTTFWKHVQNEEGARYEHELETTPGFFGDMISFGARHVRTGRSEQDCIELVKSFAGMSPVELKIVRELATGANETSAANALSVELQQHRLRHAENLAREQQQAAERQKEAERAQEEAERKLKQEKAKQEAKQAYEKQQAQLAAEARAKEAEARRQEELERERKDREAKQAEAARAAKKVREARLEAKRKQRQLAEERAEAARLAEEQRQELELRRRLEEQERTRRALHSRSRSSMYAKGSVNGLSRWGYCAQSTCSNWKVVHYYKCASCKIHCCTTCMDGEKRIQHYVGCSFGWAGWGAASVLV